MTRSRLEWFDLDLTNLGRGFTASAVRSLDVDTILPGTGGLAITGRGTKGTLGVLAPAEEKTGNGARGAALPPGLLAKSEPTTGTGLGIIPTALPAAGIAAVKSGNGGNGAEPGNGIRGAPAGVSCGNGPPDIKEPDGDVAVGKGGFTAIRSLVGAGAAGGSASGGAKGDSDVTEAEALGSAAKDGLRLNFSTGGSPATESFAIGVAGTEAADAPTLGIGTVEAIGGGESGAGTAGGGTAGVARFKRRGVTSDSSLMCKQTVSKTPSLLKNKKRRTEKGAPSWNFTRPRGPPDVRRIDETA